MNDPLFVEARWAREQGIAFTTPPEPVGRATFDAAKAASLADLHAFPDSPCIDFGRFVERRPRFVVRPADRVQLARCLGRFSDRRIPFTTRAAAHSSGGQVLTDGGAVLDLSGLDRVARAGSGRVSAEAGCRWRAVSAVLAATGERPAVLTDNLETTVGGTLAVGGFGETSHAEGLQIDTVEALSIMTLDGRLHAVGPGDPLHAYSLGGRGQLGVIVEASIRTVRSTRTLCSRGGDWDRLADFAAEMPSVLAEGRFECIAAAVRFDAHYPVAAEFGNFRDPEGYTDVPLFRRLRCRTFVPMMRVRSLDDVPPEAFPNCCVPALEASIPLTDLATWERIGARVIESGLVDRCVGRRARICVLPGRQTLPLAPLPRTPLALFFALRPRMALAEVTRFLPVLKAIGDDVLDAGGRIYLMSVDAGWDRLAARNFGAEHPALLALKRQHDPHGLLNPGLLDLADGG